MQHKLSIVLLATGLLLASANLGYSQPSKEAEEAVATGEAAEKSRNLNAALAKYNEAIRIDPKYALAYTRRADLYVAMHNFDKALLDNNEVIRLNPTSAGAYGDRADTYSHLGDVESAFADANKAIHLDPKFARAYNALGIVYDSCARKLLAADGKNADELFDRISMHFDGPPKKLDDEQLSLPFDGSVEKFRVAAGKLALTRKVELLRDYSGAAFKDAVDAKPDYDFANNNLGVYYALRNKHGDMERAEKYFRAAVKANPRYGDAFNNLGIVLTRQGKLDEAIAAYKAGIPCRPVELASDHINLCRVYLQKGELDEALRETSQALECDRNCLSAWGSRVDIFLKQENLAEATKCVHVMIGKDAKSSETIRALGTFARKCQELKRYDDAVASLGQFIKANGSAPQAYIMRGDIYLQKRDFDHAKKDFEQVLRLSPKFPGIQQRLDTIKAESEKQP